MEIAIYIILYLLGVAVFHFIEYKTEKEFTYFGFLSWIGVILLGYVVFMRHIENQLKK